MARRNMTPGAITNPPQLPAPANIPGATPATSTISEPLKKLSKGNFINLIVSFVLSLGAYWGAYSFLSGHGVNFLLSHIIGFILGLMILAYLDYFFKSEIKMGVPVFILMSIMFIGSLSIHYLPMYDEYVKKQATEKSVVSPVLKDVLTFKGEESLTSSIYLNVGQRCRVTISNPVYVKNVNTWEELNPESGVTDFIVNSDGPLVFKGIKNSGGAQSTVMIEVRNRR